MAFVSALVGLGACKRDRALAEPDARAEDEPAAVAPQPLEPRVPLASARCVRAELPAAATVGDVLEVGQTVPFAGGVALGLLRELGALPTRSAALFASDLASVRVVDLGASAGDAPAPVPFVIDGALFVAYYTRAQREAKGERTMEVLRVEPQGGPRDRFTQQADESYAFDVAGGERGALVAWDEESARGGLSAIYATHYRPGGDIASARSGVRAGAHRISGEATDADAPRLARRPGGYFAVWAAHRAERDPGGPHAMRSQPSEGPAEGRSWGWLEAVALDEMGFATGPIRELLRSDGHVSSFDVNARGDALEVIARDDEEAGEGSGGRLLRVIVRAEGAVAPEVLAPRAVGGGVPVLLGNRDGAGWVFFADTTDQVRALPLGGVPRASWSIEPALEGGEALGCAEERGRAPGQTTFLAALWGSARLGRLIGVVCTP